MDVNMKCRQYNQFIDASDHISCYSVLYKSEYLHKLNGVGSYGYNVQYADTSNAKANGAVKNLNI